MKILLQNGMMFHVPCDDMIVRESYLSLRDDQDYPIGMIFHNVAGTFRDDVNITRIEES